MTIFSLLALLCSVSYLLIGSYVLQLQYKSALNRLFCTYAVVSSIYCFAEYSLLMVESYEMAQLWLKVRSVWPLTFGLALHFNLLVSRHVRWLKQPYKRFFIYLPAFTYFLLDLLSDRVTGSPIFRAGAWTYDPPLDSFWYQSSGPYALLFIVLCTGIALRYYFTEKDPALHGQARLLLAANLSILLVVILNSFLIKQEGFEHWRLESVLLLGSNLILALAVIRYNMMRITPRLVSNEILATLSNFVILINQNGKISAVNQAFCNITDFQEDELQSLSFLFEEKIELKNVHDFETRMRHKDGHWIPVLISVSTVEIKLSSKCAYVLTGSELTRIKKTEEELAHKVQALRRTNKNLREFANVIAHDLSEPSRLISSFAQVLTRRYYDMLDEEGNEYLKILQSESRRMQAQIRGLVQHSELQTPDFQEVSLDLIAQEAIEALDRTVQDSRVEIRIQPLPTVFVDRLQLRELFIQLISNALKFRSQTYPKLQISATKTAEGWTLAFTDNGIGIPPEYQQQIFGIFQRLHLREEYPGLGLGLAVCQKIVEHHQGRIRLESRPGEGSTFWVDLPTLQPSPSPVHN